MKKWLLIVLIGIISLGTIWLYVNKDIPKESQKVEVTTLNMDFEVFEKSYTYIKDDKDSFSVKYAQIRNGDDLELTEKINDSLKNAMISWVNDECEWVEKFQLGLQYRNSNYLSVMYDAEFESSNPNSFEVDYVQIGIIIDLKTGERVFLDDILDMKSLKDTLLNYTVESGDSPSIDEDETEEILLYASISENDYMTEMLKSDSNANLFVKSYLMSKPTIYLRNEEIAITRGRISLGNILIKLDE